MGRKAKAAGNRPDGPAPPRTAIAGSARSRRLAMTILSVAALSVALWLIASWVDVAALRRAAAVVRGSPASALLAVTAFGAAFGLRAVLWRRVLPGLPLPQALAAIHVGLAANHLLPLRLGEGVRALSLARHSAFSIRAAVASTVVLRSADVLALAGLGWLLGPAVLHRHLGWLAWAAPAVFGGVLWAAIRWLRCLPERGDGRIRSPDAVVVAGTVAAWLLEAVLVWFAAHWVGIPLTPTEAVVVTAASVVSQVAGLAPGGIGTYEAAAVAAYVALGHAGDQGLAAAVVAHALTTGYSVVAGAGGLALFRVAPAVGRRRSRPVRGQATIGAGVPGPALTPLSAPRVPLVDRDLS